MSLNSVNGAQPRLYTFAEMGYVTQPPQTQVAAVPDATTGTDSVELAGKKPKKKISKGVIAAIATVAVAALAAFGLAKAGKSYNGSEKLFTLDNFAQGFGRLKDFVLVDIPSKVSGLLRGKGDGVPPSEVPNDLLEGLGDGI